MLQGRHPHGRSLWFESEDDYTIAGNALVQVGAEHLLDRWMHQLSGGEKQRVVLARALAQQPMVLLLDEPTLHLDIGAQVNLMTRLRDLAEQHRYTVIIVTHELSLAAEFADQIVLLHRCKCLRVGPPADVYEQGLLEQVFEAPLEVDIGPTGRPRVTIHGRREQANELTTLSAPNSQVACATSRLTGSASVFTGRDAPIDHHRELRVREDGTSRRRRATVRRRLPRASHCPAEVFRASRMGRPPASGRQAIGYLPADVFAACARRKTP